MLLTAADPERPTSVVFDLDPGEPAGPVHAATVPTMLRHALETLGLRSFVKTSGVKGLHVVVPLGTPATFEQTKALARTIAGAVARAWPDMIVDRQAKDLRRGRVLVDWLQNDHRRSTVAPYSLRAARAPVVSTPLTWDELDVAVAGAPSSAFVIGPDAVRDRLACAVDPFAGIDRVIQSLPALEEA